MSFWTSLARRLMPTQRKMTSEEVWLSLYGGRSSRAGVTVNWKAALDVPTVLACARVIAEGISQVPLRLYRASDDGKSRLPAIDHPLYSVLYRRPNQWQTSFEYRETMALHLVLCGNAYSFRNMVRSNVVELLPFEPQWVAVDRSSSGAPENYKVTLPTGQAKDFPPEAIWHVRGPSWNSYLGMDAVLLAREAIGLAMATENSHAAFHRNGARPSGIISVDGKLSEQQYKQLRDWIARNQGSDNAGTPLIVDNGAKWQAQAMSGVDAQHLETRKYQVEEICRALRVMPIMVGYSDKASTYASAEQMFLAHVVHTLSPWYERIEQSIDVNLLSQSDRDSGVYSCFDENELLRAAMKDTGDYLIKLVNGGLMTPNEGRAKLDLNPDGDPASDELRIPVNVAQAPNADPNAAPAPAGA